MYIGYWSLNKYYFYYYLCAISVSGHRKHLSTMHHPQRKMIQPHQTVLLLLANTKKDILHKIHISFVNIAMDILTYISLLLVPFMKQKLITLRIIEPFTETQRMQCKLYNIYQIQCIYQMKFSLYLPDSAKTMSTCGCMVEDQTPP